MKNANANDEMRAQDKQFVASFVPREQHSNIFINFNFVYRKCHSSSLQAKSQFKKREELAEALDNSVTISLQLFRPKESHSATKFN